MENINEIKEKYLVQILCANGKTGNGILVGKYLITAGHVVNQTNFTAYAQSGVPIEFNNCIALQNNDKTDDGLFYDIAVFELVDVESPLELVNTPNYDDTYTSIFIERHVERSADDIFDYQEELFAKETCGKVIGSTGNFFACEMGIALREGSSGSPLIKNGKVYGILHGGQEPVGKPMEHGKICVYLSSVAIINYLNQLK